MKESWKVRKRSENVLSASDNLKKLKERELLIKKAYIHFEKNESKNQSTSKKNKNKNQSFDLFNYLDFRNKYYQDILSNKTNENTILRDLGYNNDFLIDKYLEKNKRKTVDNIVNSHNISIDFYDSMNRKNDFVDKSNENDFEYN